MEEHYMLGNPNFKMQDRVSFNIETPNGSRTIDGVVYVIDANGTDSQRAEPSYDIEALYEGRVILFKHIPESRVVPRQ